MGEWTKEPWKVVRCVQKSYRSVAFSTKRDEPYTTSPLLPADARRIVACVNALAGIPTDKLAAHVAAVARLRDVAREAMELAAEGLSYTPEYFIEKHGMQKRYDELAAALAAMEGSK